jgi:hypothetical protein
LAKNAKLRQPFLAHTLKMSKKTKASNLNETLKAQLHLDIVANPTYSCDDIINQIPNRDYKAHTRAVQNRYAYLQKKKVNDPQNYWSLYAIANKDAVHGGAKSVDAEESIEEVPSTPVSAHASPSERHVTTPTIHISTPHSSNNMYSGSRGKSSASPAAGSFAYNTMFETLEDAELAGMFLFH